MTYPIFWLGHLGILFLYYNFFILQDQIIHQKLNALCTGLYVFPGQCFCFRWCIFGHPGNCFFSPQRMIFIGSKHPKWYLISFCKPRHWSLCIPCPFSTFVCNVSLFHVHTSSSFFYFPVQTSDHVFTFQQQTCWILQTYIYRFLVPEIDNIQGVLTGILAKIQSRGQTRTSGSFLAEISARLPRIFFILIFYQRLFCNVSQKSNVTFLIQKHWPGLDIQTRCRFHSDEMLAIVTLLRIVSA